MLYGTGPSPQRKAAMRRRMIRSLTMTKILPDEEFKIWIAAQNKKAMEDNTGVTNESIDCVSPQISGVTVVHNTSHKESLIEQSTLNSSTTSFMESDTIETELKEDDSCVSNVRQESQESPCITSMSQECHNLPDSTSKQEEFFDASPVWSHQRTVTLTLSQLHAIIESHVTKAVDQLKQELKQAQVQSSVTIPPPAFQPSIRRDSGISIPSQSQLDKEYVCDGLPSTVLACPDDQVHIQGTGVTSHEKPLVQPHHVPPVITVSPSSEPHSDHTSSTMNDSEDWDNCSDTNKYPYMTPCRPLESYRLPDHVVKEAIEKERLRYQREHASDAIVQKLIRSANKAMNQTASLLPRSFVGWINRGYELYDKVQEWTAKSDYKTSKMAG